MENIKIENYKELICDLLCEKVNFDICEKHLDVIIDEFEKILNDINNNISDKRAIGILRSRYGVYDGEYKTFKIIGKKYNLSSSWASQIVAKRFRAITHPKYRKKFREILVPYEIAR